jgi:GNAT superfamily N-acetyltransferase
VIRPATEDDYAAAARLLAACYTDRIITEAGMRHFAAGTPERAQRRFWLAERDGEVVGWATAGLNHESSDPGAGWAGVSVHPEQRRRGIGGGLWTAVAEHLDRIGARRTGSSGDDSEPTERFAVARGFRKTLTQRISSLDPRKLPPPPAPPAGVDLLPFSAFADDPRQVWRLDVETSADIPLDQPIEDVRYDEWLAMYWSFPGVDHGLSLVAVVDGEPAAFTMLRVDPESGRAETHMTGTLRAFRGRGLALLVKQHSLAAAAARGVELALTENDETNAPMLAVNTRLGYRPSSSRVSFVRDP